MLARVKRWTRIRGGGVTRVSNGVWRLKWRMGVEIGKIMGRVVGPTWVNRASDESRERALRCNRDMRARKAEGPARETCPRGYGRVGPRGCTRRYVFPEHLLPRHSGTNQLGRNTCPSVQMVLFFKDFL